VAATQEKRYIYEKNHKDNKGDTLWVKNFVIFLSSVLKTLKAFSRKMHCHPIDDRRNLLND